LEDIHPEDESTLKDLQLTIALYLGFQPFLHNLHFFPKEHVASIFRVKESAKEASNKQNKLSGMHGMDIG
jgi:hypothetical protein